MRRRDFITLVGSSAIAWPVTARAQQGQRVRCIGVLMSISETNPAAQVNVTAFAAGLREQGWIEGRNVQIDYRWARGQPDLVRKFAAELVAAQPDIIVSQGAPNAVALRDATRTIPIVFLYVSDPIGMGVVESMRRPGGNITGFATFEPSLGGKWLELLKELSPGIRRTAIVYNPDTAPNAPVFIGTAQKAGSALGVAAVVTAVRDDVAINQEIAEFARAPGGSIMLLPDQFTADRPHVLVAAAIRHHLPLISPYRAIPTAGGLASYGIDFGSTQSPSRSLCRSHSPWGEPLGASNSTADQV